MEQSPLKVTRALPACGEAVCDSHVPGAHPASAAVPAHSPELLPGASRGRREQNALAKPGKLGTNSGRRFTFAMLVNPRSCPQGQPCSGSVPRGTADTSRGWGNDTPLSLPAFFVILDAFVFRCTEHAVSEPERQPPHKHQHQPDPAPWLRAAVPGLTSVPWVPPADAPAGHRVATLQTDL